MTFVRVEGARPSAAQRRTLILIEQHAPWSAGSVLPATRAKLIALGLVELRCRHCRHEMTGDQVNNAALELTDKGRKYLANWRKAYGSVAA